MAYEVKSLIDQGKLPNYNSPQLNGNYMWGRLSVARVSGLGALSMAPWRLQRCGVDGVHRRQHTAAATSGDIGKRRRSWLWWSARCPGMVWRRCSGSPELGKREKTAAAREGGLGIGAHQRRLCGRKAVTTTTRTLGVGGGGWEAATVVSAHSGDGSVGGFGKRGERGRDRRYL
uniref:Uncharacterized protein n=1 Tax=Oryza punctata TaxID=4537 RepID=A0A0E0LKC7_ORYPU